MSHADDARDASGRGSREEPAPAQARRDPGEPLVPKGRQDHVAAGLADGFRKAEPYMLASSTLVACVVVFAALGAWLDRKMGHSVQWLAVVGGAFGTVAGIASFFRKAVRPARRR